MFHLWITKKNHICKGKQYIIKKVTSLFALIVINLKKEVIYVMLLLKIKKFKIYYFVLKTIIYLKSSSSISISSLKLQAPNQI